MVRLEPHDVTYFATPADLRVWLETNHATAADLWVGFPPKDSARHSITWVQLVDEVLAFGWVDSVRMPLTEGSSIRLTPRRPRSIWSARNVGIVERLRAEGRMHPAGEAAFERRTAELTAVYSFEGDWRLDEASLEVLAADPAALAFWEVQPPGYRRQTAHLVMSAKRNETRAKRLAALVAGCAAGERLAEITGRPRPKGA